jgi:pSer/pThr/pTyr-binding forkhead associated (FHA) protein
MVVQPPSPELVKRLSLERPLPASVSTAPPPVETRLVCTSGALSGREFAIGSAGIMLGRDPASAQIVVSDPQVSKRHAWVGYRDGRLIAADHGSTNGTFLNGMRIRESRVVPGDRLELAAAIAFDVR